MKFAKNRRYCSKRGRRLTYLSWGQIGPESHTLFRQVISFLLMCAVLTSHWAAAVPHSHAGMSPSERELHNRTPHVHLGQRSHSGHGHSGHSHSGHSHSGHSHSGHSHSVHSGHSHHPGHAHSTCSDECPESDGFPAGTIPEHDDHVVPIYLGWALIGNASQPSIRLATMNGDLFSGTALLSGSDWPVIVRRLDSGWLYDQPPDHRNRGTSTYLWTRRIRL